MAQSAPAVSGSPKPARQRRVQKGEPFVWLSGGAIMTGIVLIVLVVGLIVYEGSRTFWPRDLEVIALGESRFLLQTSDGRQAFLDAEDRLLLPQGEGYTYADGRRYALTLPPRKAGIADFRRAPGTFGISIENYIFPKARIYSRNSKTFIEDFIQTASFFY